MIIGIAMGIGIGIEREIRVRHCFARTNMFSRENSWYSLRPPAT